MTISMRNTFLDTLQELARKDKRIVFLTGDLGFSVVEKFQKEFPDRFYNVGIAEQNMVGLATGLAEAGMIPFVYSIAPFSLVRPFEFIKNGPIFHNLPVRIVSVGPGLEYGHLGFSHYLLEDIALTRIYNNFNCYAPVNNLTAKNILQNSYDLTNPAYYRISKNYLTLCEDSLDDYNDANIISFQKNKKSNICVIAHGEMAEEALKARKDKKDLFDLYSLVKYNPLDDISLLNILKEYDFVISYEAHYINNGLGSLVAEILAENSAKTILKRIGIDSIKFDKIGSKDFMYKNYNINSDQLIKTIKKLNNN